MTDYRRIGDSIMEQNDGTGKADLLKLIATGRIFDPEIVSNEELQAAHRKWAEKNPDQLLARNQIMGFLGSSLQSRTGFITWFKEPPSKVITNGSFFLLNVDGLVIGVTAYHVITGLLRSKEIDSRAIPTLGGKGGVRAIDLSTRLMSSNKYLDVATFYLRANEIAALGMEPMRLCGQEQVNENDLVGLCGFPGSLRQDANRASNFQLYYHFGLVSSASEETLVCSMEPGRSTGADGLTMTTPNLDTGGMSGGPIVLIRKVEDYFNPPVIAVIKEGYLGWDSIFASRSNCIQKDGTVKRSVVNFDVVRTLDR